MMTRALWQPRLNRCLAKYRRKATDCPLPGVNDRSRKNMQSGDGSRSIDNLMGFQRIEMVGPNVNIGIALPDTLKLPGYNSGPSPLNADGNFVYAEAVVVDEEVDAVQTADTALPVDRI